MGQFFRIGHRVVGDAHQRVPLTKDLRKVHNKRTWSNGASLNYQAKVGLGVESKHRYAERALTLFKQERGIDGVELRLQLSSNASLPGNSSFGYIFACPLL